MLKKIVIIMVLISGIAFGQMDNIVQKSGEKISELYPFNGSNGFWFKVDPNFNGSKITWLVSAYNNKDSLTALKDQYNDTLMVFTVTAGDSYMFYPPKSFAMKLWGAMMSDVPADKNFTHRISKGKY